MTQMQEHDDRTEKPTAKRLEKARRDGKAALSRDLVGSLVLLAGFAVMLLFGTTMFVAVSSMMDEILGNLASLRIDGSNAVLLLNTVIEKVFVIAGPILLALFFVALVSTWLQVGFRFRIAEIVPDFERLDPIKSAREILGQDGFGRMVFSFVKITVVVLLVARGVSGLLFGPESLVSMGLAAPSAVWSAAGTRILWVFIEVSGALLFIAGADWAFKRRKYQQSLMMSKREVQEEQREVHGDPLMRRRRQQIHSNFTYERELPDVSDVQALIVAGDLISIALSPGSETDVTQLVSRIFRGAVVDQSKTACRNAGIPVVEAPLLAHELANGVDQGGVIPTNLRKQVKGVIDSLQVHESATVQTKELITRRGI
ncbi:MAG: EscU/YscU/HrcU family type III secretion system export apparatus switch protein [Planctomycetota bacterium]